MREIIVLNTELEDHRPLVKKLASHLPVKVRLGKVTDIIHSDLLMISSSVSFSKLMNFYMKQGIYSHLSQRLIAHKPVLCSGTAFNVLFTSQKQDSENHEAPEKKLAHTIEDFWFDEKKNTEKTLGLAEFPGTLRALPTQDLTVQGRQWRLPYKEAVVEWNFASTFSLASQPQAIFSEGEIEVLAAVYNSPLSAVAASLEFTDQPEKIVTSWLEIESVV